MQDLSILFPDDGKHCTDCGAPIIIHEDGMWHGRYECGRFDFANKTPCPNKKETPDAAELQ